MYNHEKAILITVISALFAAIVLTLVITKYDGDKFYDEVLNKADSGYEIYIDGAEVEKDHIYLEGYPKRNIQVDDEKKIIRISTVMC